MPSYSDKKSSIGGAALGLGVFLSMLGLALWINHCKGPQEQTPTTQAAPK